MIEKKMIYYQVCDIICSPFNLVRVLIIFQKKQKVLSTIANALTERIFYFLLSYLFFEKKYFVVCYLQYEESVETHNIYCTSKNIKQHTIYFTAEYRNTHTHFWSIDSFFSYRYLHCNQFSIDFGRHDVIMGKKQILKISRIVCITLDWIIFFIGYFLSSLFCLREAQILLLILPKK